MSDEHFEYMRRNAYPSIVAEGLGLECMNLGLGGSSNRRIVRTTIIELEQLKKKYESKDVFVLIGLTHSGRFEINITGYHNTFVSVIPNGHPMTEGANSAERRYAKERMAYVNESLIELLTENFMHIIALQNYLKANQFAYTFTFGFGCKYEDFFDETEIEEAMSCSELCKLFEVVDTSKFMGCTETTSLREFIHAEYGMSFYTECLSKGLLPHPASHPLEEGHKYWASVILSFINN
jgi:hypothetical protein